MTCSCVGDSSARRPACSFATKWREPVVTPPPSEINQAARGTPCVLISVENEQEDLAEGGPQRRGPGKGVEDSSVRFTNREWLLGLVRG